CRAIPVPEGSVVAEGGLVALRNVTLNALGPDGDSAAFFFDHGAPNGQYLRWFDGANRFELSRDLDALGNVTARHHVGTVTAVVASGNVTGVVLLATAATEGNEATVFLRGSAHLVSGTATVSFPPVFRALIGSGPITAQVTPTSRGSPLFVSEKAPDHITVEALLQAPADQTFDYFVQATRGASEDFQPVLAG
ncbi:MAG: hypothetical protein LC624_11150, partial [Halobacteriales archaeon]|nr:hypothetical protein [Halobacteriales archaeon]